MAAEAASNGCSIAVFAMNKIADLFIGTYCIEHGHELLQSGSDFEPMAWVCALHLLR